MPATPARPTCAPTKFDQPAADDMCSNIQLSGALDLVGERARPIIDLADSLREMGVQEKLPIPQIAVMGDQSSGKSSVLEAISGIPFPRGSGLVTRCPTMVIMSRSPVWSALVLARGQTYPVDDEKDKEKISEHIKALTRILAGDGNDFASNDEFIEVKLAGPNMPDLTIIDLPGIVRTEMDGQSAGVIEKVKDMLGYYLKQPRTIVLAVIPSNADVATSEILQMAKVVDPGGARTVGVLTKPDLVDKGAEDEVLQVHDDLAHTLIMFMQISAYAVLHNRCYSIGGSH
jgi:interferon-induced GTP-binding protein Mx1